MHEIAIHESVDINIKGQVLKKKFTWLSRKNDFQTFSF